MRVKLTFLSILLLLVTIPNLAIAAGAGMHYFDCKECHASGLSLGALTTGNVCLKCHDTQTDKTTFLNAGNPHGVPYNVAIKGNAKFSGGDASSRYGNNPAPADQISHNWATSPTQPAAGATNPPLALHPTMSGNRGRNTSTLNCSRCHNTHGAFDLVVNPSLLVNSDDRTEIMATDDLCTACHTGFSGGIADPGNDALMTHPLLNATQLAVAQADVDNAGKFIDMVGTLPVYEHTDPYANNIQLVDNAAGNAGVSCMTCHGLHFADSKSSTPDGPGVASEPLFSGGDGLLLRSDGPTSLDTVSYNGVTNRYNTAQLRSNLCQTCHTYKMHGDPAYNSSPGSENPNHNIGCLDCHGGHSYNGGTPSLYVLSDESPDAVPTRFQKTYNGDVQVTYPVVYNTTTRTIWADNVVGQATGFCEVCHGDVNDPAAGGLANSVDQHKTTGGDECSNCHTHGDSGYSFKLDASAASCGDCHGFPPYLNTRGDRAAWYDSRDGGYAYYNSAGYNYLDDSGHFKNEEQTAHKTHAGRDLKSAANTAVLGAEGWYFVGSTGIDNCKPCHGADAGKTEGGHKVEPTTNSATFRDVPFDVIATGQGNLSPSYNNTANSCDNVYCHTAGAPRLSDVSRNWAAGNSGAPNTPTWDQASPDQGFGQGFNSIIGAGTRCQTCHGNDIDSMSTKGNTSAHAVHINSATLNYACGVCHENTAIDNTTLSANATDHRAASGGLHVNGVQDVVFNSTVFGGVLDADKNSYDSVGGTCSVYCHDPGNTGLSADWDNGPLACNACHENTALTSGSHAIHVDPGLADISCDSCHGAGASLGTHANHVDGTPDVTAGVCDSCHGVENSGPAWDVTPTWGNATSEDCRTCHTGAVTTSYNSASLANIAAPDKSTALTVGHNVPTGNPNYTVTDNLAANKTCEDCHISLTTGHVDGAPGDNRLVGGFNCNDCHTDGGSRNAEATVRVMTHDNTDVGYTLKKQADFGKACFACHDPHGSSNIAMIHDSQTKQNSVDPDSPAKDFSGDVVFGDFNSFDPVAGSNLQAICATCHTATAHNSQAGSPPDAAHNEGTDCQSCHDHNQAVGGFMPTGGTACNDCHGNPPTIADNRMPHNGNPGAHAVHTIVGSDDPSEDTSDCGVCHAGAESYTLSPAGTHMDGSTDGDLVAGITNDNCTSACHNSVSAGDGSWSDADGLSCNACHGNAPTDDQHNAHTITAGKACADCHQTSDAQAPGPLSHISAPDSGIDDAADVADMADAQPAEANVNFSNNPTGTSYSFDGNTCSSGTNNGLGCHASGQANWDDFNTGNDCIDCHTNTTNTNVNPTSGLHGGTLTVTNNNHDGSFDNGAGNPTGGNCETCHTATPSASHRDGNFDATIDAAGNTAINFVTGANGINYVDATAPSCLPQGTLSACHSDGGFWTYNWDSDSRSDTGVAGDECDNCHGDFGNAWNPGVIHNESGNESRGSSHSATGSLSYPCGDCHAIGSTNYAFTSGTHDWNAAAGETSNHGDGIITMNDSTTNTPDEATRAGCATTSCHQNDAAHSFLITSTGLPRTPYVVGNDVEADCSLCHGGEPGSGGNSKNGYWPNGVNTLGDDGTPDNQGEHAAHILALAKAVYPLDAGTDIQTIDNLLTDATSNYSGLTSDAKQKELCSYCHDTPGSDADHSETYPAELNGYYTIWDKSAGNAGGYNTGDGTCSTTDCHNGKPTPASQGWYAGGASDCDMCHLDVNTENTHADHIGAAGTFGIDTITCATCHQAATNWATTTPPATGHINGTFSVDGGTVIDGTTNQYTGYSYPSVKGSCGTNDCHENGKGGVPNVPTYNWDTSQPDCTLCHDNPNTAGNDGTRHTQHMDSALGYACGDCHTAETQNSHINFTVNVGGTQNLNYAAAPGCTNNCHLVDTARGDWTDTDVLDCTDCHSSTFVGGGTNMPQYNMHVVTPVTSGVVHDDSLVTCAYCHDSVTGLGSHIDGTWAVDSNDNAAGGQDRGLFSAFTDAATPSCIGSGVNKVAGCHLDDGVWARKWDATAAVNDATRCANCHGDYSGWNTGVIHADRPTFGNSTHTGVGDLTYECTDCHVIGATTGVYTFTDSSNDWNVNTPETSNHGNNVLEINAKTAVHNRSGGRAGCSGCHENADGTPNAHDFPASAWTVDNTLVGDEESAAAGCVGCHGAGDQYWPQNRTVSVENSIAGTTAQGGGKHEEHMIAIADRLFPLDSGATLANLVLDTTANYSTSSEDKQRAICEYCHAAGSSTVDDRDGDHGGVDSTHVFVDFESDRHANNLFGQPDGDATYDYVTGTCSTVDCHFNNSVTPHWYDASDLDPAANALTAEAATDKGATPLIDEYRPHAVRLSWMAPGDDGNVANTTAYVYDVRYSTSPISDDIDFGNATQAGNLPATYIQGSATEMYVDGLEGPSYYFAMKTRDTKGNWSNLSSAGPVTPTADTAAPFFGGANKAFNGDEGQTINVTWTAAEDHTMPITYKVWAKPASAGALDMDNAGDDVYIVQAAWTDTKIELESLTNDMEYSVGVRACDNVTPTPNCDTNTQVVKATPTSPPEVDLSYPLYVTAGSSTLVRNGTPTSTVGPTAVDGSPLVFAAPTRGYPVNYFVDTFAIWVVGPSNGSGKIRAEIGKTTDGTAGTWVGSGYQTAEIDVPKRANRIFQFKLVDTSGQPLQAGEGIAIALTSSTANVEVQYGDATNRGDMTVGEQIVNLAPNGLDISATTGIGVDDAIVEITWLGNEATDDLDGLDGSSTDNPLDTVHYDVYGSDDNGSTFKYVIAEGLPDTATGIDWDTQSAGIVSTTNGGIAVRVRAGDGYSHSEVIQTNLGTADSTDYVAPSAITDLLARKRPKSGTVWLTWTAPGDDYDNHGRAAEYDIRYRLVTDGAITLGNWDSAQTQTVTHEPYPDFGGSIQHYEVTDLQPNTDYYFAIRTLDEAGNISDLSSAKTPGSDQMLGGPRCGMCHTTGPSVVNSAGNHKLHGFTLQDCNKCHTEDPAGANLQPSDFGLDHQDGRLVMGFGDLGAFEAVETTASRILYTHNGQPTSGTGIPIYDDGDTGGGTAGGGGFNDPLNPFVPLGDGVDNGNCFNFYNRVTGGCHGPAGVDSDGWADGDITTEPAPYVAPGWNDTATLDCAYCHGDPSRTEDAYGRPFDAGLSDQVIGSPPADNRGGTTGIYVGKHEKHLNYSFRFSKGDSCNLCHTGEYADRYALDGKHGNGEIDVQLDLVAAGADAVFTPSNGATPASCGTMSPESCHPTASTPTWDSTVSFDCYNCHGMGGVIPPHTSTGGADDGKGNCTFCHFPGHPLDDVSGTAFIIPNSSQVGINYRSQGIHLRATIDGRGPFTTEAELCWGCHDANGISEWGNDTAPLNVSTAPDNGSNYNYGFVNGGSSSAWVVGGTGAPWASSEANFSYKSGKIQSTHSTDFTNGQADLTGSDFNYFESVDAVADIHCSNCHDVHDLAKAAGDKAEGAPYLRGSWVRNPYKEDGAPWNKAYAVTNTDFDAVPRAGHLTDSNQGNELGGYQIDQNNGFPTSGLSRATSSGLCTLCHSGTVDTMDKFTTGPGDSTGLWMGALGVANGHSNATLGGTANMAQNIFGNGIGGRPVPNAAAADGNAGAGDVFDMALQTIPNQLGATTEYGYGYRSPENGTGKYSPSVPSRPRAYNSFVWGVTVDQTSIDVGYHAFTCSKCHNPHASRLPKLLITNCLDTRQNSWDNNRGSQQTFWSSAEDGNNSEWTATHNTAQNCHRYDPIDGVGGWNKVTPWITAPP